MLHLVDDGIERRGGVPMSGGGGFVSGGGGII
jgi:hypothetical protein